MAPCVLHQYLQYLNQRRHGICFAVSPAAFVSSILLAKEVVRSKCTTTGVLQFEHNLIDQSHLWLEELNDVCIPTNNCPEQV